MAPVYIDIATMRSWSAEEVARAAGARLHRTRNDASGPALATIDSRAAGPGTLFVGLPGTNTHGGEFAAQALEQGAWGVLTDVQHAAALPSQGGAAILAADDPLAALQRLATAWRRQLGAQVIGVTGSTGKTSTKELLFGVLAPHRRTVASRANFNTEIGLPLEILAASADTEVLILEMGMRGAGQIGELAAIAEPDVGVIVSIGPVHLELLGTVEAIAAAKAELIAALPAHGTAVLPAGEALLGPHLRSDVRTLTFGEGGDVHVRTATETHVSIVTPAGGVELDVNFAQAHLRQNLLAAVAAAEAIGVTPEGRLDFDIPAGRGRRTSLATGVTLIDDCYNANPMSMRAALDDLATTAKASGARRVAVLGDMLELGPGAAAFHQEIGAHANRTTDVLVTVGPLAEHMSSAYEHEHHHAEQATAAAEIVSSLLRPGDVVLVKGSRGVALEQVCEALTTTPASR